MSTRRLSSVWTVIVALVMVPLVAGALFMIVAQAQAKSLLPTRATNATAEQDMRMVMQELDRERLEPLNANSSAASLCTTNTAVEQDMRMVMQEYQCERFEPLFSAPSFTK